MNYDPADTDDATQPAARQGLVAGTVNGIVYAAGGAVAGSTPVGTLDAYDPATNTWFARAPMPTPRSFAAGGVVDGMLYVAGGSNGTSSLATVEAYDPVTNTWTTKASMPAPLATATAAVADGVIYVMAGAPYRQSVVYAYDTVGDFWTVKAPMRTPRAFLAAASLNGVIYAVGGEDPAPICCDRSTDVVETYVDRDLDPKPAMVFYPGAELAGDSTNWWGPSAACIEALLKMIGFARVESRVGAAHNRQVLHAWWK